MNVETIEDLEVLLTDEPECQSLHQDPRDKVCTVSVTHIGSRDCGAGGSKFICQGSADFVEWSASLGALCSECHQPVSTHWHTRPI